MIVLNFSNRFVHFLGCISNLLRGEIRMHHFFKVILDELLKEYLPLLVDYAIYYDAGDDP